LCQASPKTRLVLEMEVGLRAEKAARTESSRSRLAAVWIIAIALAVVPGSEVLGHKGSRVTICIPYYKGGPCSKGKKTPSYYYGKRIPIKGKTRPEHGGVVRIQRRKGAKPWRVVARQRLDDRGRYRYVWHTEGKDADQGTPYKFRTILSSHDTSRVRKVYVVVTE